jgi:hypothetical protein
MTKLAKHNGSDWLKSLGRPIGLRAEITLRFGATRLPGQVHWPPHPDNRERSPLVVLLADPVDASEANPFGARLSSAAAAVVLSFTTGAAPPRLVGSGEDQEWSALGWAAEHAAELGADPEWLCIAGMYRGGGRAARVASSARDNAWPGLCRQLLVHPTFSAAHPMPSNMIRVAPATIAAIGARDTDGRRYAARLRAAGIEVEELRTAGQNLPTTRQLGHLARLLRTDHRAGAPGPMPRTDSQHGR